MAKETSENQTRRPRQSEAVAPDVSGQPGGGIDFPAIRARLAAEGHVFTCAEVPARFAGGLANVNLRVELDGRPAVLRCPPFGPLPRGANDMAREHRVLRALASQWPLAPQNLYFCADPAVAGVPFQILEFREGVVVRGDKLAPLPETAETGERLTDLVIDTLVSLHAIDPVAIGLGHLGRPHGHLTRTRDGWIRRAHDVVPSPTKATLTLIDWLERKVVDRAVAPTLLHNDVKLDNMILSPDGMRVSALLDWDMATRGDPLFDLATLLSYWTEPGDPPCMHRLAQMPTARAGFATRAEVMARYAERSRRNLEGFLPIRILAMFKLGVVFHQLHAQHGKRDPRYAAFDTLADELLDFAADTAFGAHDT